MKKILFILIACLLASCNDTDTAHGKLIISDKENNPYFGRFKQYGTGTNMNIVVDTQTNCEYLIGRGGGIQPIGSCERKQ